MDEVKEIDAAVHSTERLFVVDCHGGPGRGECRAGLRRGLDLTGVILTKADGDARGGAALSVRNITGKPIVFLGVGEKTEALEPFDPERMASRVLGMGDVISLVEQVHRQVDHEEAQRLAEKVVKGKGFDMADLKSQLEQLQKMGGVGALLDKLPAAAAQKGGVNRGPGRPRPAPPDCHHQFHDPQGAPHTRRSSTAPAAGGSPRLGNAGSGREPAYEAVHGDAADDEEHEGREAAAHARRLEGQMLPAGFPGRCRPGSSPLKPYQNRDKICALFGRALRRFRDLFWGLLIPGGYPRRASRVNDHGNDSPDDGAGRAISPSITSS